MIHLIALNKLRGESLLRFLLGSGGEDVGLARATLSHTYKLREAWWDHQNGHLWILIKSHIYVEKPAARGETST